MNTYINRTGHGQVERKKQMYKYRQIQIVRILNKYIFKSMNQFIGQIKILIDRYIDRYIDRWMGGWVERQIDVQISR